MSILWIVLVLVFSVQVSSAQNNAPAEMVLSGSTFKSEDVLAKADVVFVGTITEAGSEVLLPPTAPYAGPLYGGVKVNVLQVLRGSIGAQVSVSLFTSFVHHEKLHTVGSSYIFFVKKNAPGQPDPYTALKLLPATGDNIAKVKALIATAPASK